MAEAVSRRNRAGDIAMDNELDILAFRFFKLFAQYEWALKALGYVRTDSRNGAALAEWQGFANGPGKQALDLTDPKATAALQYLFGEPPKLQVYVDGELRWKDVSGDDKSAQALFGHIQRIRNNLYHGGKFNGNWFQPERNQELISDALALLEALRDYDTQLREAIAANAA